MYISKNKAAQQIASILENGVPEQCPDWLKPLADYVGGRQSKDLSIANTSVDLSRDLSSLSQGALDFDQRVGNLVTNIQTLSAAIEEMSASAVEVGNLGQDVLDQASQVSEFTTESTGALADMESRLNEVDSSLTSANDEMESLAEQTRKVETLTNAVNEISEQTNLLALNAAIEAARAGDAGRGFAVVADEVRKLAARSAEAAQEINDIVTHIISGSENVQAKLANSVRAVQASADSRKRVTEVIHKTSESSGINYDQATSIAAAAEQQSQVAADMARQVSSNSEDSDALAGIFSEIMQGLGPLRTRMDDIFSEVPLNSSCLRLASAKRDHVVWVDKLIRFAVFHEQSITEAEVKNHNQCRLGQFLASSDAGVVNTLPQADALISDAHPQVHRIGQQLYKEAVKFYEHGGDPEGYASTTETLVQELKTSSAAVIELLDAMITEMLKRGNGHC